MRDFQLRLLEAVEPQVATETGLRRQLSVAGKVVVKLIWSQIGRCSLQIPYVEPYLKITLGIFLLRNLYPTQLFSCPSIIGLCVPRLTSYRALILSRYSHVLSWGSQRVGPVSDFTG